jgi:hypothetical protein
MAIPDLENASVLQKITTSGFKDITQKDYVATASAAVDGIGIAEKFSPRFGKIVPYSSTISAALGGTQAYLEENEYRKRVSKYFERASLRYNPILRRRLENGGVDWSSMAGSMASSAAGAAIGAAGAGALVSAIPFLLPVMPFALPVALLVGSGVGGYVGNSLYNDAFVKQPQDPIIINMQAIKMRSDGETVPPEVIFAALAANLKGRGGQYAEDRLLKYTGTKLFTEALSDPQNMSKLTAMMNNSRIDNVLRAQYKIPHDEQNPYKTVAEQYADLINSGQIRAQDMLKPGKGLDIYIRSRTAMGNAYNIDVPATPEMRQNAISREI